MNKDEEQCLKLGRMVVRMIRDLQGAVPQGDVGYARRTVTFPGGEVQLFVASDKTLADRMEATAASQYDVTTATPRSQKN